MLILRTSPDTIRDRTHLLLRERSRFVDFVSKDPFQFVTGKGCLKNANQSYTLERAISRLRLYSRRETVLPQRIVFPMPQMPQGGGGEEEGDF